MSLPTIEDIKNCYKTGQLLDFYNIAMQAIDYINNNTHVTHEFLGYELRTSNFDSALETRPISKYLYIHDMIDITDSISRILSEPQSNYEGEFGIYQRAIIYTIQQSVGAYLDLISPPQTARKVAGEFFQSFIKAIFSQRYTTSSGNIPLKISSIDNIDLNKLAENEKDKKEKVNLSFDLLIRPPMTQIRNNLDLSGQCVVCGFKTTTKDRGNMFYVDRYLYRKTHKHRPKFIAVVLNDVQRKRSNGKTVGISYTFLRGHNRLYQHVMGELDGYYYVDPPPAVESEIAIGVGNMKTIDSLLNEDLPKFLEGPVD